MHGENYDELLHPARSGVLRVPGFIDDALLRSAQHDSYEVAWRDVHSTYVNARGLTIVQNHDAYALDLVRGSHEPLKRLGSLAVVAAKVMDYVGELAQEIPTLKDWTPTEQSLHRYDDPDIGLSFHKDNLRFRGLIPIVTIEGSCDLAVRHPDGTVHYVATEPGDLVALRAPGLTTETDDRPEHAVVNLRTPTRTSMMLRHNNRPYDDLPGFDFDNL